MPKEREIRAFYTDTTIRVYQAFNHLIADSALRNKTFVSPPFKVARTTWIKPSFLWMMYRSGWATKENQERILAIDISRSGFIWALNNSRASRLLDHVDRGCGTSSNSKCPVIIQWDPERDLFLNKLNYRTLQMGLTPMASKLYIEEWITSISDITNSVRQAKALVDKKNIDEVSTILPKETVYPLPEFINRNIGAGN